MAYLAVCDIGVSTRYLQNGNWVIDPSEANQFLLPNLIQPALVKRISTLAGLKMARHAYVTRSDNLEWRSAVYDANPAVNYWSFLEAALDGIHPYQYHTSPNDDPFHGIYKFSSIAKAAVINAINLADLDLYIRLSPSAYGDFIMATGEYTSKPNLARRVLHFARSSPPHWHVYADYFKHAMTVAQPRMIYGPYLFFKTEDDRLTFKLAMEGETTTGSLREITKPILDILG